MQKIRLYALIYLKKSSINYETGVNTSFVLHL
jgi:hypothetical protein